MTEPTSESEKRVQRIELWLDRLMERQIHTDNRLDRFENGLEDTQKILKRNAEQIERNSLLIERNSQLIERNSMQIADLAREIGFLRAAVLGHISQATPPAHPD